MTTRTDPESKPKNFREFLRAANAMEREAQTKRHPLWEVLIGTFLAMVLGWFFHTYIQPTATPPEGGIAGDLLFGLFWGCLRTGAWRRKPN